MSSREQSQQLLETIDAVLAACSGDPRRRRPARSPARPAWNGPSSWSDLDASAGLGLEARQAS